MAEMTEAYDWRGRTMLDSGGEKIGTIDQVYPDVADGSPEWALVETGFFGTRSLFVPIASARPRGEQVQVDVTKDAVDTAPLIEASEELSSDHEGILLRHYGEMIRSEEELQLSTVWRPRTRVRLRKYVVTEMVTRTVPVRREKVLLEHEPIPDGSTASSDEELPSADELIEVVLHEEQLVIEKRVVPTERVRLRKETITEHRVVRDELRKEQLELDTPE